MISVGKSELHSPFFSDYFKIDVPISGIARVRLLRLAYCVLVFVLVTSFVISAYFWVAKPHLVRDRVLDSAWLSHVAGMVLEPNIFRKNIRAYLEPIPLVDLDLSFRATKTMEYAGLLAVEHNKPSLLEYARVPGYIRVGKDAFRVNLRFKGTDLNVHVQDSKPSFRVVIKDDGAFFGFRRFALMSPERRGLLHEWVFRQALRREAIIAKRYELIRLRINGEEKGIYVVDEHFDVQLAEHNGRPDSIFLRFSDPWTFSGEHPPRPTDDGAFFDTKIVTYGRYRSEAYKELLERATHLLSAFRNNDLQLSQVFDVTLFARYFALADIFNAWHGLSFANMRFFFNPVTGLLEPVPDDNYNEVVSGTPDDRFSRLLDTYNTGFLLRKFMADRSFRKIYATELLRLSESDYLEEFWSSLEPTLDGKINVLRRDYPLFDFRYVARTGGVVGVLKDQGVGVDEINEKAKQLRLRHQMLFKNHGLTARKEASVGTSGDSACYLKQGTDAFAMWSAFRKPGTGHRISVPKGQWVISHDVMVSPGCILEFQPGSKVMLDNGARLVSHAPIVAVGSVSDPIVFGTSGLSDRPGGVLVIGTQERSVFNNVIFSGLSIGPEGRRFLKGAVTFYKADFDISNSVFRDNFDGDDMLNVIASDFSIRHTEFINSYADSFDADFSTGSVEDVQIQDVGRHWASGGDGLDLSGSRVSINDVTISNVADKAVSAGENSIVEIDGISISRAQNGIVSKDGTRLKCRNVSFSFVDRGLVAIRKKKGYAPAALEAETVSFNSVATPILLDQGLTLTINELSQDPNTLRGARLIYP